MFREEQEKCSALGVSNVWPRTLLINDDGGELRIELANAPRSEVVERVITDSVSAAQVGNVVSHARAAVENSDEIEKVQSEHKPTQHDTSNDQAFLVFDPVPEIISPKDYEARLKSATLWLQHLREFKRAATIQATALDLAFGIPDRPVRNCYDETQADQRIDILVTQVKGIHNVLQQAVPCSQSDPLIAELIELGEQDKKKYGIGTLEDNGALVRRNMHERKPIPQRGRRRAFNRAFHDLKSDPADRWISFARNVDLEEVSNRSLERVEDLLLTRSSFTGLFRR